MKNTHSASACETADGDDRRADGRLKVDLLLNRFLDGFPYMCRAMDISRTGIRVMPLLEPAREAALPCRPPSRFVGLQFQLPGTDQVITASGEEVFADRSPGPVGIRFTSIAPNHAALIDSFLAA